MGRGSRFQNSTELMFRSSRPLEVEAHHEPNDEAYDDSQGQNATAQPSRSR